MSDWLLGKMTLDLRLSVLVKLQREPSGQARVTVAIFTTATRNSTYQNALAVFMGLERWVIGTHMATQKELPASGSAQDCHLMPLTFSGSLAQPFLCLSLSFPIWNVIMPDLTASQGSYAFRDIRAHACGMTLKSYKSTGGRNTKVRRCSRASGFHIVSGIPSRASGLRDAG